KDAGAKVYANYMIGLPWETKADIQATAAMADQIAAEMPSWAYFTPYPGCEVTTECVANNWSLLTRETYDRYPGGRKIKNVDYDYIARVLRGFREPTTPYLCDIIVPTYENSEYTIACFESLKKFTEPGTYRIIWIDNGSKDISEVEESLKGTDYISIKLTKNEGFVGATNRGIQASTSPFVCFLNNDTIVSKGWLDKLITTLSADDKLGILGPVTQPLPFDPQLERYDSQHSLALHSSLLPKIYADLTLSDINEHLEKNYKGQTITISFVAFLCAVAKREVINKVGLLDTHYAMGMYDDNDYNLAARKLGYRTELASDTCIYHHGRTTFKLIEKVEKFDVKKLLRDNLLYLNQKWGLTRGRIVLGGSRADPALSYRSNNWRSRIAEAQEKLNQKHKKANG
ncbi:glycosyltransferase, partial [Candidatus Bathyarchaeota archaeon]|nr:glycosyltransferase [Candidatus Bathyarchaeota archaeon]